MDMNLESGQYQEQRLEQRPSPTLVTFTQILALSSYELQHAIQQEISENPALELVDNLDNCMRCGERLVVGRYLPALRWAWRR
jgi:DNA-directed RNA polymerase specialized sigma54-like protein